MLQECATLSFVVVAALFPCQGRIDAAFHPADLDKFKNIRFSSHWLFEISRMSFSGTVANQQFDWLQV
jgi:hypothetical protein